MNPFSGILKEINEKLELPQPEKSRIILEISSDLTDSMEHYLSLGLSRDAAVKKAMERFNVSDESLHQLTEIHESLVRRLMDRLSKQVQTRWERSVLLFLLLFILLYTGNVLLSEDFFVKASRFIWPLAGVFLTALGLSIWKFYLLYIKRDHRPVRLRSGLQLLFFLGVSSLFLGMYGVFVETYLVLRLILGNMEIAPMLGMKYLLGVSSLMIISLLATILTSLIWFILMNKICRIEQAEAAMLLGD